MVAHLSEPELRHKMSKKIAQLTKVIFHLNTRNEDAQENLTRTTGGHEIERAKIIQDATLKLRQSQDDMKTLKQKWTRTKDASKRLKDQHTKDREEAFAEFQTYQLLMETKEREVQQMFENQLSKLQTQCTKVRERYQLKLKDQVDAAKAECQEVFAKECQDRESGHQKEIQDMVQESNTKYNTMLTQQLNEKDALEAKFNASLAAALQNQAQHLEEQHLSHMSTQKSELEDAHANAIRKLREESDRDKTHALETTTEAGDQMKHQLMTKVEQLLVECADFRQNAQDQETNMQSLKAELVTTSERLAQTQEHLTRECQVHAQCQEKLRLDQLTFESTQVALSDQIQTLTTELKTKHSQIETLEQKLQDQVENFHKLQTQTQASMEKQTQEMLSRYEAERRTLGQEHAQALESNTAEHQKRIEDWKVERETFKSKLETQAQTLRESEQEAQEKIKEVLEEHALECQTLNEKWDSQQQACEDKWKAKTQRLVQEHQEKLAKESQKWEAKYQKLQDQLDQVHRLDYPAQLKSQAQEFQRTLKAAELSWKQAESSRMLALDTEHSHEKEKLRQEFELQGHEDQKRFEETLKKKLEALRKTLGQEDQAQAQAREAQAQAQAQAQARQHEAHLIELKNKLELDNKTSLEKLVAQHQMDIEKQHRTSEKERQVLRHSFERTVVECREELERCHRTLETQLLELKEDAHQKWTLVQTHVRQQQEAHEQTLAQFNQELDQSRVLVRQEHREEIQQLEIRWKATNASIVQDFETQIARMANIHAEDMAAQHLTHVSRESELSAQVQSTRAQLEDRVTQLGRCQTAETQARHDIVRLTEEALAQQDAHALAMKNQEHQSMTKLGEIQRAQEQQMQELVETHVKETQGFQEEMTQLRETYAQTKAEMIESLVVLQNRFDTRPSREEDLERLDALEEELRAQNLLVKRTKEEMVYFKRELVNREETYNKTFARSPTVGKIQPSQQSSNSNKTSSRKIRPIIKRKITAAVALGKTPSSSSSSSSSRESLDDSTTQESLPPLHHQSNNNNHNNAHHPTNPTTSMYSSNNNRHYNR